MQECFTLPFFKFLTLHIALNKSHFYIKYLITVSGINELVQYLPGRPTEKEKARKRRRNKVQNANQADNKRKAAAGEPGKDINYYLYTKVIY